MLCQTNHSSVYRFACIHRFAKCMCLLVFTVSAQQAGAQLLIRDVRVFDGSSVLAASDVLVEDGLIARVGHGLTAPQDAFVVDGTGRTLLPGLIDSHTHVVFPDMLSQALALGVTTELDMFMDWEAARQIKRRQDRDEAPGMADLRTAGTLVTAPGGHGTEYGLSIPTINQPSEAQEFVDARIAEGSDYIKIVYDTGKSYGISYPSISRETMAAVVEAAHARGKLAVVHIATLAGARAAIEVGADALVHLFFEDTTAPEFGRLAAKHGVFIVPTLTVLESASGVPSGAKLAEDEGIAPYLSETPLNNLKQSFPGREGAQEAFSAAKAAIRQLKTAGVPILAGSDAPNAGTAHGASIHRELELLVEAGLTPIEALRAATSVPAARFGLTDRGRIEPGLRADLLLVKGDPTTDITATRNIVAVWKKGVRVDRPAYLQSLKTRQGIPVPEGSEEGLVSDFEGKEASVRFGAGWAVSTDSLIGGKSIADIAVVQGGTATSRGSLSVSGVIDDRPMPRWAGAMFYPGPFPMTPADLSSKKSLEFWAKGDGKTYAVMLFARSRGFTPVGKTFVAGPAWERHRFLISDFDGLDGHDLMGVFFGGGAQVGPFKLQIDDVRFDGGREG